MQNQSTKGLIYFLYMRQFNFNLELDFEIQSFKSSEEKLDFLRKKYLEIKDNYKFQEYEAIKIYLQGKF